MTTSPRYIANRETACAPDAVTNQVHASSVTGLSNGDMACVWFGGSREGRPDVAIYGALRRDGAWGAPVLVAKLADIPHWNPVLFVDDGALYLFFKIGGSPRNWATFWCALDPNSLSPLTAPRALVPGDVGGCGPVRSRPLALPGGRWVAPNSLESKTEWTACFDISDDRGATWTAGAPIRASLPGTVPKPPAGIIQPTLWRQADGTLKAYLRSTYGVVFETVSQDDGATWSEAKPLPIPNNNSALEVLSLPGGSLVMALNPVKGNWVQRTPLVLMGSGDGGRTWAELARLETEKGEFSYPSLTTTQDGFAVSYTWNRKAIVVWTFRRASLSQAG
ncbi:MAG: exo-alpha-sialidase [Alphaproteobacteria bacterium]|nr:exo-alpha-sialidase [Alphaproteobacteria bacterium]